MWIDDKTILIPWKCLGRQKKKRLSKNLLFRKIRMGTNYKFLKLILCHPFSFCYMYRVYSCNKITTTWNFSWKEYNCPSGFLTNTILNFAQEWFFPSKFLVMWSKTWMVVVFPIQLFWQLHFDKFFFVI